jgi:hypothetical protein
MRPGGEAHELRVDRLDEARGPGEERRPHPTVAVEASRHGESLSGQEAAGPGRQAGGDDPAHRLGLVEDARAPLYLQLAGMEGPLHNLPTPRAGPV